MEDKFQKDDQKKIVDALMEYFGHDIECVTRWLMTQNILLGNVAPIVMIRLGRSHKLLKFIESELT